MTEILPTYCCAHGRLTRSQAQATESGVAAAIADAHAGERVTAPEGEWKTVTSIGAVDFYELPEQQLLADIADHASTTF